MTDLEQLVATAHSSELFSAPHLEADSGRFLSEHAEVVKELAERARQSARQVYFVGSGGSWASMYSGKYLFDRVTSIPADVALSYELIWRAPQRLDAESIVFLASYSGRTEDTLAALRFARSRGAHTVALVRDADSPIGSEADTTIAYTSPGLYSLPLLAVTLFACEWGKAEGSPLADELLQAVPALPGQIGEAFRNQRERGRELAAELADSTLLYAIGAGPLLGLAYKFGLTVFMENMRIHGSVIEIGRVPPRPGRDAGSPDGRSGGAAGHRRVACDDAAHARVRPRKRCPGDHLRRRRLPRGASAVDAVCAQDRAAVVHRLLDLHARHR